MSDIVPLLDACVWHERRTKRILRTKRIGHGGVWRFGQRVTVRRAPLGHVAIIATWNYPYQLLGIQLVQAIAAGNNVTVKPSERSPRCQLALLELARDAGLDASRLDWTDATREAGREMLERGTFDHVVFTGSTAIGRDIAGALAGSLTPSTLELSGSDSAIVLGDADAGLAADSIYFALALNSGQSCMAPRRVIVEDGAYKQFIDAFTKKFEQQARCRLVRGSEAQHCRSLVEQGRAMGAGVVSSDLDSSTGFAPTAILDCPADADVASSDHFGPAIAVLRSGSRSETLSLAGLSNKALATSIFTNSPAEAQTIAREIGSGFITINDCMVPTAHPGASLAGRGPSGWGVSRGELGLLAMTRPQFVSKTSRKLRLPTEEPSQRVQRNIERFVRWRYSR
ncbi:MAG: aldehyde dehydrogenase family protein [Phycisphaera sp.]|nr:MAG: aldehyde dehydrogenase family protein [Phycisphaera sp.]